jgi:ectoine hydroxylase-related dioxygenase (phytanoyl-CoA dioxygenase family)
MNMPELTRFSASEDIEAIGNELLRSGGVIVEGLLSADQLSAINAEMDPLLEASDPAIKHLNPVLDDFFGKQVRHVTGMPGKSSLFAEEVMCHPVYRALCDRILLPNCADYRLNLGHLMDRGPGSERQWLHRDQDVWIHFRDPKPELQVASIVALGDFSRDNGATCVVPGSHRWDKSRQAGEAEIAFAEMPAGSAVIYLGSTIHAGGSNATGQWRRGFHLSYCLGWLRTEENNILACPPDCARRLSLRAQQLLGYGVHDAIEDMGGYLGMVDMRQPTDLLKEGSL